MAGQICPFRLTGRHTEHYSSGWLRRRSTQAVRPPMKLVEIRTYKLKVGAAQRFVVVLQEALPLVRESGMDVVAFGRSDHEHESFYLIRAYNDRAHLEQQQDAFYSSDAWRNGPREPLLACLVDYLNTLVWLSDQSVEDLRSHNGLVTPSAA